MAIFNLGSINIDHLYQVPHLPALGETVAALSHATGLGGKGANQSVAAALAGASVRHIGAVGHDGTVARERLAAFGVDVRHVALHPDHATGHAIVFVDPAGENAIVIHRGANAAQSGTGITDALQAVTTDDTLLLQNETSHQVFAAAAARARGMRVICSAAPFDPAAVRAVLPHVTHLVLNAVEARQLAEALGTDPRALPAPVVIVTRGADGADWCAHGEAPLHVPSFPADVVDTTGAGDCFTGFIAAALDSGAAPHEAMRFAAAAAALQVSRPGAAAAMPARAEVEALLARA